MKVLLTHGYFLDEDPKERAIMKPYPPLGILSIAAWLRERDFEVSIFDSTFESFDRMMEVVRADPPDAIGLYVNLMTRPRVLDIIERLKGEDVLSTIPVILGGPEVTHHVEPLLKSGADFCIVGEGEVTMQETLRAIRDGLPFEDVDGLAWKDSDDENRTIIRRNPERERMKRIDGLPTPARDLIDVEAYLNVWREAHGYGSVSVSTMRGCPFSCRWCSRAVYGASYRRRPAAEVAAELAHVTHRYGPEAIWFVDDVFTISPRWMRELDAEIRKAGVSIRYECITRADRLDEEMIDLLVSSGCFRVWIGAESGSQRILDAMDRRVEATHVRDMIQRCREKGLETGTFIMLGYPGETEEDILETIEHLKESLPDHFTVTTAYPITGTPLYDEVEERITSDLSWHERTDRDLDFPRPYPRSYYRMALRRMANSVESERIKQRSGPLSKRLVHQAKAAIATVGMFLTRKIDRVDR